MKRHHMLDRRQREFARLVARGDKVLDAYEQAGFARHRGNARRLMKDDLVRSEIARLRPSGQCDPIVDRALKPRQRAFARALAFNLEPRAAYIAAGYVDHPHNGARLAQDDRVVAEVERLRRDDQACAEAFRDANSENAIEIYRNHMLKRMRDEHGDNQQRTTDFDEMLERLSQLRRHAGTTESD
jgi:hypothetical protein